MLCLIAVEKEVAPVIRDNLQKCGLYPEWNFEICDSAEDLTSWSHEKVDVILVSRFLPGADAHSLLGRLRTFFPTTHIVLLVGKESEQRRNYIKVAHQNGLDNIVTGRLPGDRPYNIFTALTSARTGETLEWDECKEESATEKDILKAQNPDRVIFSGELRTREIFADSQMDSSTQGGFGTTLHAGDVDTIRKRLPGMLSEEKTNLADSNKGDIGKHVVTGSNVGGFGKHVITEASRESRTEKTFPRSRRGPGGKIILTAANKGGVGKTTVSLALAISLARAGIRTCLADLDLTGPNVAAFFDLKGGTGLEIISRRGDLHRVLPEITAKIEENLYVLPGIMDKTLPDIAPETALEVIETIAGDYDVVVCDTSPGFWEKDWLLDIFPKADMIMSVVDQSKFSEVETRDYAPKLIMMGVDPARIRIVLNRFNPKLHNVKKVEAYYNEGLKKAKVLPRVIVTIPENWESFVKDGYKADIPGINDPLSPWGRLADEVGKAFEFNLRRIEKHKEKKSLFGGLIRR